MKKLNFGCQVFLAVGALGYVGFAVLPANAQYVNPAQQDAIIQQDAASGLISPGQASDLIRRENDLAARESRLLRNDGGVLTPRDQQKIWQEQARDNAILNNDVANRGRGFFSNLFGPSPVVPVAPITTYPANVPYGYPAYSPPIYTTPPAVYGGPVPYHHRRWERDHWMYY